MNANEMQQYCQNQGVMKCVRFDDDAGVSCRPVGLCPRCKQPISFSLTNGGKLKPSKTLRLQHVFTGSIRCEDYATNQTISGMTGQQKLDFFINRKDAAILKEFGLA